MGDIVQVIEVLWECFECDGRVGVIGYCLGGYFVFLIVCWIFVDVSVGYYGVGIENFLYEVNDFDCLLMFYIVECD